MSRKKRKKTKKRKINEIRTDQGDYSREELKPLFDSKTQYYYYTEILKNGFKL